MVLCNSTRSYTRLPSILAFPRVHKAQSTPCLPALAGVHDLLAGIRPSMIPDIDDP